MRKTVPTFAQLLLIVVFILGHHVSFSQGVGNPGGKKGKKEIPQAALDHIKKNKQKLKLSDEDIADLELSSESESRKTGVKHLYLKQTHEGIEIHGAVTNISMKDGKVINVGNRFHKEVGKKIKIKKPDIDASDAVAAAARHLNTPITEPLSVKEKGKGKNSEVLFTNGGISLEPIPARLVYQPMEDGSLKLAWEVSIYELDAQNWWNIRIDANTGEFLDKDNMVVHCQFDNNGPEGTFLHANHPHSTISPYVANVKTEAANTAVTSGYNVFAMPFESPSHGPRAMVSNSAADETASPNGWHYTPVGDETRTRGNNVFAYEDPNNNNNYVTNYSPDGGSELLFDFPVDFTKQPVTYRDAAITNLFYWNNIIHDVWYQYGFDEESGNFQYDNFGKGGAQSDPVLAEAQDNRNGTSRNNANFSTPRDGFVPRMQMYLWSSPPDEDMFRVTSPSSIAGSYTATEAAWAKKLDSTPLTGRLVVAMDGTSLPTEGCETFVNAAEIAGNIAVVYRGNCAFTQKVENAQTAGAIGVVVINNAPGGPIAMGGTPTIEITIPAVMIGQESGALIREKIDAGEDVLISLKDDGRPEIDGDFDNGIIVHEYGHGISNRLTGGPDIANCLNNAEQMGEGWSDWFGLMMTMRSGDTAEKVRGIGTYAQGQPTDGQGIRPAPYSTDRSVNNYTYAATNDETLSRPHGIGFVWSTMLWDMTWALIDQYGFDEDIYHGSGGNNMAMQLVIDGLKFQACRPGFVDGRDAILAADIANYGGANQELIWKAFAGRGLGFSAEQGSNTSRLDQVEAFDMPPVYACDAPEIAVTPTSNVFTGGDAKVIYIGYGPQSVKLTASGDPTFTYSWSPAEGLSNSNIANPVFTPTTEGSYTFTVTAVNADECTRTASVTINVIDVRCGNKNDKVALCVNDVSICANPNAVAALLTRGDGVLGDCGVSINTASESLSLKAMPNPFSSTTKIEFTTKDAGNYRLEIRNGEGILLMVLAEGYSQAGELHSLDFNRGNLQEGLYVARLVTDKESVISRIVLGK